MIFGRTFDRLGSYEPIMNIAMVLLVVAAVLMLTMGRYPDLAAGRSR